MNERQTEAEAKSLGALELASTGRGAGAKHGRMQRRTMSGDGDVSRDGRLHWKERKRATQEEEIRAADGRGVHGSVEDGMECNMVDGGGGTDRGGDNCNTPQPPSRTRVQQPPARRLSPPRGRNNHYGGGARPLPAVCALL